MTERLFHAFTGYQRIPERFREVARRRIPEVRTKLEQARLNIEGDK